MKILHITNNFPTPNFPIFGIFIKEQIDSLRKLGAENEVFFINSREEGRAAYLRSLGRLRKHLKANSYDIIHCHHSYSGVLFLLSGRWKSANRLLSYQSDPRHEGGIILFRILYRFFDRVILKNKPEEADLSKTIYLPNGVNSGFFFPMDKNTCKLKLGLEPDKRYILFMDSYNRRPCKRLDRYSATLAILRKKYNYSDIEPLVLTNTGRSLIPAYINASDLHLLTSDFEGSPNSVKECMACNIPVVSTPVGNVRDLLAGVEGSYVADSFSPEELADLSDRSLRATGVNSRELLAAKDLDIETVAGKLLYIYGDILEGRRLKTPDAEGQAQSSRLHFPDNDSSGSQPPLKVLLINNCHYRRGGADVVYLNTGDLLESRGHEVAYFSTKSQYNYSTKYSDYFVRDIDALKLNFVEQLVYMPRKLYSREAQRKLGKVIDDFKPDLAHIHLYKGGLTAAILPVLERKKVPAAITLHDYSLLCPRNIMIDGDGKICERCLTATRLNCVYHRCNRKNLYYSIVNYIEFVINNNYFNPASYFNRIICVSRFNYLKHSNHPLFKERFVHLYNFYPLLSQSNPKTAKGSYFLFYGRLAPEKGVMTLISTWKRLGKEVQLKIIGEGVMSARIKDEIRESNLHNVEFLGFRKGEELFSFIRDASFVLVPSEWYENNPLTIVEAYSVGKPVIGSNIGGIPELIIEGRTGFLFEMGDSGELEKIIRTAAEMNEDQYLEMSEAAYRFACDKFSEKDHYRDLLKIYREVINASKHEQGPTVSEI
jgi:glycosyltransferase involved in cell wall biosynthesis